MHPAGNVRRPLPFSQATSCPFVSAFDTDVLQYPKGIIQDPLKVR